MSGELKEIKGIYFDLDDTLCGYWSASATALRETFEEHAPGDLSSEELVQHWAEAFREFSPEIKTEKWYTVYLKSGEVTRTEQMRRMLSRIGLLEPETAEQLSRTYGSRRDLHLSLFPDALAVLSELKTSFPLGLITNGPADIQRMEIASLGIGHFFGPVFIEGELGFGKPEPEVFVRAAEAMHLEPNQLLMVGNSYHHDIRPAIEAGWSTAWIRRPSDVPPSSIPAQPESLPKGAPEPTLEIMELSQLLSAIA